MGLFRRININTSNKNIIDLNDKRIYDSLCNFFETLLRKSTQKLSLDEIISIYETNIDQMIIESVKMDRLNYVDGKFEIVLNEDNISIKVDCYFQDWNQNWIKKDSLNKIELYRLTDESIMTIKSNKIITFNIEKPNIF